MPISVRATVSICCSPPLICPPGQSCMAPRLGNSSYSAPGCQFGAALPSGQRRAGWRPTSRFSVTVRSVNTRRSSGTKPRPSRAISNGCRPAISRPMNSTAPRRLASRPMTALNVVDLPAPLRPISATTSPRRTSRSTSNRIWAAPYQAFSPATRSSAGACVAAAARVGSATVLMLRLRRNVSRRSCRCRNTLPAPWDGCGSPARPPRR
ncbi:Uncharacterised protein [Bordetella pertussis]|nr:Uncharacterised protein [Bordetella pertussis]